MDTQSTSKQTYLFYIEGIRCHSCVRKLESIPNGEERVLSAHLYFGQNLLETQVNSIEPDEIKSIISGLGFKAQYIEKEAESFERQKKDNRALLNKVGVAGFIAGNTMLFSIPIYGGLEDGFYKTAFSYLSFVLFLPIVFFCALDFYKNALAAVKNKTLNIDLPITVALISGFVFSTYNLITHNFDYLYFDSTASFIFLILSARFFLQRIQQKFVHVNRLLADVEDKTYSITREHQNLFVKAKDVRINDIINLQANEIVPVDGTLINSTSTFDTSFLNGESFPQVYQESMQISSGCITLAKDTKLKACSVYASSGLRKLINKVESVKRTKGKYIVLADRAAHYLVLTVFVVAAAFFITYMQVNTFEAFQRALALLIVACPCALALGVPLTYALGIKKAQAHDIYIKEQNIFDKMLNIKTIFFDKTGTLTHGQLTLKSSSIVSESDKNIILNLEKISKHPIAFAFRSAWAASYQPLEVLEHHEVSGRGVEGIIDGIKYKLVSGSSNSAARVLLYKDDSILQSFEFEDSLREDSVSSIENLRKQGYELYLLSGDAKNSVTEIANAVGIPLERALYEKTPQQKLEIVEAKPHALMIGDGINDALAIEAASVGVAVKGNLALSLDHSEVYFLKLGIYSLLDLIQISKKVRRCLLANMGISFAYNLIAGSMALLGYINPLLAAILMPISSFIILANTLRMLR